MQQFVDQGEVAGVVTLVADKDAVLHCEAVGKSDLERGRAMQVDDLFWIASMTKPMTAICVMMLEDEGKLSMEDPVEKHLVEFRGAWMAESREKDRMVLGRPKRAVTIRDLLTHTGGLRDFKIPRVDSTLGEAVMAYSREPLQFEPGSQWSYSNPGINTLGRIVEVVSGMPFAEFLQTRLLDPLGMKSTTFWPSPEALAKLATSYKRGKDGGPLEKTDLYFTQGDLSNRKRTPVPAGGLFSTAQDVVRVYQMMLHGGEWNGVRLLKPETVRKMTTTQTGDIKTGFTEGMSWGLGFQVVKEPQGVTQMLAAGSFGHGGAYGTQSWADPQSGRVYVMLVQRSGFPNGDASSVRWGFQEVAAGWKK
ncbi:MAG: hypothetical protein RLZZ142_7 [Verrucomicrobiota bacterium]